MNAVACLALLAEIKSPFTRAVLQFFAAYPWLGTLLILTVLDMVSGILAAFIAKKMSSNVTWRGATRKAMMFLVVGVAAALEPYAGDIPLVKLIAMFYVVWEALSILENAALIGVPIPKALVEALVKLRNIDKLREMSPTAPSVHIDKIVTKQLQVGETSSIVQSGSQPKSKPKIIIPPPDDIGLGQEPEHSGE